MVYKHIILMNCLICGKEIQRKVNNQKYCTSCKNKPELDQKANWKIRNKEIVNIKNKEYSKINKTKINELHRTYKERYKNKNKARMIARYIKIENGYLCDICKINLAKEKHHIDYNNPKDLLFLCKNCHIKIHKKEDKARDGKRIYKRK